jgi:hypothetical protein
VTVGVIGKDVFTVRPVCGVIGCVFSFS